MQHSFRSPAPSFVPLSTASLTPPHTIVAANESIRTGSLTGTMVQVIDGKLPEASKIPSYCRFSDADYTNCEIKGAMNYNPGPVTVQFQTDGSNYNGTTRNNQDFFGFRAYYFTGSDATNLQAMGKLLTGRIDHILLQSINDIADQVAGATHDFTFLCPVRNYTVFTCSKDVACAPACPAALSLTCCGGFCVPVDEYGDAYVQRLLQYIIL